jgi:hypoxanthine phosphoribosyltransferase
MVWTCPDHPGRPGRAFRDARVYAVARAVVLAVVLFYTNVYSYRPPDVMNREEALHIFRHSEEIVSAQDVNASISGMAAAIAAEMSEEFPLVLSVMGGAAVFTGMLLPHLDFPLEFDYIHLTRYRNSTKGGSEMQWRVAPAESVKDRVVLVLDDILDEGETMAAIRDRILDMGAKRFMSAVLCEKIIPKAKPLRPDFCGFEVPDRYVFGCGMDAKGYWRNLPTIRALTDGA